MTAETQIKFWQKTLEGAPALTEAPTDRARPAAVDAQHYGIVKQQIPGDVVKSSHDECSRRSLKASLLTSWQARNHRTRDSNLVMTGGRRHLDPCLRGR